MAACQGYQCEFVDSVSEDFYCKKCTLVARRLHITNCCNESFCQTCIVDAQEQELPCPVCGEKEFTVIKHVKNQKKINSLHVNCSMKERGCVWSGTLDQLDTHLDPHLDNCQYVDTKCPLNCLQTVPKNMVDQHVAQECSKRPHVCQHCGFKASYEEVEDTHLPECKYVPLQCPNMCGVSCEREVMEDHMKTCRLKEVECEFSSVGCDSRFIREEQDEHARQNSQKHLTLTASLAVETKEKLQQKLLEQDKKHKEEEEQLKKKLEDQTIKLGALEKKLRGQENMLQEKEKKLEVQEKRLQEQEKKLEEQEKKLGGQEKKLEEQEKKLGEQEKKLESKDTAMAELKQSQKQLEGTLKEVDETSKHNQQKVTDLFNMTVLKRRFEMTNFEANKAKDKPYEWKTQAMYTHMYGYKFCIGVDANGWRDGRGKFVSLAMWFMPGEFDDQLNWPAKGRFTVELINTKKGENVSKTVYCPWDRPDKPACIRYIYEFISHSKLGNYVANDTLYFNVSRIELL